MPSRPRPRLPSGTPVSSAYSSALPTRTWPRASSPSVLSSSTVVRALVTDEDGVRARYGIGPRSIPDWLALVGDSADGFPGLSGWGRQSTSAVLAHYGHIDAIPDDIADWEPELARAVRSSAKLAARLAAERESAMLFRELATLRIDPTLLKDVDELRWRGPGPGFAGMCRYLRDESLVDRVGSDQEALNPL